MNLHLRQSNATHLGGCDESRLGQATGETDHQDCQTAFVVGYRWVDPQHRTDGRAPLHSSNRNLDFEWTPDRPA